MSYIPANYSEINRYQGSYKPSTMLCTNNAEVDFYERSLYERVESNLVFTMPKEWDEAYFKYVLMGVGYIAIVNTEKYGVIPQWCSLTGIGLFLQPTHVNIHNQYVNINSAQIGKDCALIKFTHDYTGIWDIIHHYAEKLAIASTSVDMNMFNSRLAYIIGAKNKANAETIKKAIDNINAGNPNVVINTKLSCGESPDSPLWEEYSRDVKQSYIATDILNDMQTIMNDFDSEIGIPNANINKKERLITDEVNSNNAETMSRILTWIDSMKPGLEMANKLYGLNLSVRTRWQNGVLTNG